jgi:cytochrome P450
VSNVTHAGERVPLDEDSYYQDSPGFFARLRESGPVVPVWMPDYGRAWIITRYADVNAAINIAAGHAVTARGGDGITRPVNREPQLLLPSA